MSIPTLKIYGERNTGTNYLSRLIAANLQVNELPGIAPRKIVQLQNRLPGKEWVKDLYFRMTLGKNLGWKHTRVPSIDRLQRQPICQSQIMFVTLTKNPYSWLLSLHKRPYHNQPKTDGDDFEAFLVEPYQPKSRDNLSGRLASPVDVWNQKNASYLQFNESLPAARLTYEQLLADPCETLTQICQRFELDWDRQNFKNYDASTKDSHKNAEFYRRYYLQEQWREKLTPRAISLINDRVDQSLMQEFGYESIEA